MKGNTKVVGLVISLILGCTHNMDIAEAEAETGLGVDGERIKYMEKPAGSITVTWPPELDQLRGCLSRCRPDNKECIVKCADRDLKQMDPTQLQQYFEGEGSSQILESVLCTLGCAISQVCDQVETIQKANQCSEGCAEFCIIRM